MSMQVVARGLRPVGGSHTRPENGLIKAETCSLLLVRIYI